VSTLVLDTDVASLSIKHRLSPQLHARLSTSLVCVTFVTVGELPLATRNVKDFSDFAEYHGLTLVTD